MTLTLGKQKYSLDHIPTLFVATKSDLDLAQQVSQYFAPFEIMVCDAVYATPETRGPARCLLQKTKPTSASRG